MWRRHKPTARQNRVRGFYSHSTISRKWLLPPQRPWQNACHANQAWLGLKNDACGDVTSLKLHCDDLDLWTSRATPSAISPKGHHVLSSALSMISSFCSSSNEPTVIKAIGAINRQLPLRRYLRFLQFWFSTGVLFWSLFMERVLFNIARVNEVT